MPVDPYIPKEPNDLIRAADWNQIQIDAREDIASHDHSGGDSGAPLHPDAIPDGSITAAKLDPDLDLGGGSVADGSITTAKLANGAVTAAKLQQPLSSLSTDELVVGGAALRSSFDEVAYDWSWQLGDQPMKTASLKEVSWGPEVIQFAQDELDPIDEKIRRALRIVAPVIDPALAQQIGVFDAWQLSQSPHHAQMLSRLQLEDAADDALDRYEQILEFVYQPNSPAALSPGLLFAIAAQPNSSVFFDSLDLLSNLQDGEGFIKEVLLGSPSLAWHELFAGCMRPIGLIGESVANPPVLNFKPSNAKAMMEVEYTLTVRLNRPAVFGIGSIEHAPPPSSFTLASPPGEIEGTVPPSQVRLRRRIPVTAEVQRSARLWGVGIPSDPFATELLDFRVRARTLAPKPNWTEELKLDFKAGDLKFPDIANP